MPDGRILVACSKPACFQLFRADGTHLKTWQPPVSKHNGRERPISSMCVSAQGEIIVTYKTCTEMDVFKDVEDANPTVFMQADILGNSVLEGEAQRVCVNSDGHLFSMVVEDAFAINMLS